jgi:hypothetical protein
MDLDSLKTKYNIATKSKTSKLKQEVTETR